MKLLGTHSLDHSRGGFALVLALTLLAFLMLLLVSLSTFIQIETQMGSTHQFQIQARKNALLALDVALGQLQKYAGPDQRVTATPDLATDASGDRWESGSAGAPDNETASHGALAGVQDGTRFWTGVWGNANTPDSLYTENPDPVLLTWLVSGNESGPDFTAAIDGHISAAPTASAFEARPEQAVANLSATTTALSDVITLGGTSARLLVGGNTVDDVADYVVAPLVTVNDSAGLVGRYAWWIGDEGIKARYNQTDPYVSALGTGSEEGRYRALTAQRYAIERMSGLEGYATLDSDRIQKTSRVDELGLVDTSVTPSVGRQNFHNLSWHSTGVLADTHSGGLRKDLTYDLDSGALNGTRVLPEDESVFTGASTILGPSWDVIKSFHDLQDVASLPLRAASSTEQGISPVIVQVRFFLTLDVTTSRYCTILLCPVFVLGNPYTKALSGGVDLRMSDSGSTYVKIESSTGTTLSKTALRDVVQRLAFHISDVDLDPGEVKVWSPQSSVTVYPTGATVEMAEGFDPSMTVQYRGYTQLDASVFSTSAATPTQWKLVAKSGGELTVRLYPEGTDTTTPAQSLSLDSTLSYVSAIGIGDGYERTVTVDAPLVGEKFVYYVSGADITLRPLYDPVPTTNVRPYADYNLRAQSCYRPAVHDGVGNMQDNPLYRSVLFYIDSSTRFDDFTYDVVSMWGHSVSSSSGNSQLVLFDIPQRDSTEEVAFLSLAQLQHASLTADSLQESTALQPGYAFANAWASPYLPRDQVSAVRSSETYYDISYLLNTALWDRYFLSTLPQNSTSVLQPGTDTILPNSRLRFITGETASLASLQSESAPARYLMLEGAFNVNSTSEEAWMALLGGLNGITLGEEAGLSAPFPRSIRQPLGTSDLTGDASDGLSDPAYAGFRNLDATQLQDLATEIVREIRKRGPFVSLSQFVNRKLTSTTSSDAELGLKGALQAAIDRTTGINDGFPASDEQAAVTSSESNGYADQEAAIGQTMVGAPGWLTQADVLQVIGPALSARSDTFLIRAYGEVLDPITSTTNNPDVKSRAWCEALVQRFPEYVNNTLDAPTASPASDLGNRTFGRRFRIISFRWLDDNEI